MRTLLGAVMLVALSVRVATGPAARTGVLVELFTSEGCSSCPSADALLASLTRDQPLAEVEIIPIGFHVDYFNHLGWKDAFSSPDNTGRQQDYSQVFGTDSVYTPQFVVDGGEAVPGNDEGGVRRAIGSAGGRPHLSLQVTMRAAADRVPITIRLPAAPANAEKIQVIAAITEDGLSSMVTRGENHGRTLRHVAVARKVQPVGWLTTAASVLERQIEIDRAWRSNALNAVVWLQGLKCRHVYGAATARIP